MIKGVYRNHVRQSSTNLQQVLETSIMKSYGLFMLRGPGSHKQPFVLCVLQTATGWGL